MVLLPVMWARLKTQAAIGFRMLGIMHTLVKLHFEQKTRAITLAHHEGHCYN